MTVDVVILAYTLDREVFDMNTRAIQSLRAADPDIDFNVILLESNRKWPEMGLAYDAKTTVHIPDTPFNFNHYNNIGLKMGKADWVVFSNNDVVFHPGWCSAMLAAAHVNPALQCLCPWDPEGPHTPPGTFPEGAPYIEGYLVRVTFTGWCFMVRRAAFDITGPFDERFDYYFADDDFAMTLRRHDLRNAAVPGAKVTHLAHVTSKKAGVSISEKYTHDQQVFKSKWGAQRIIAWKNRLTKYFLRPLGMKGIIRQIYRTH
ncbi:MAG: hypothetical protein AAF570_09375 [Bacteroidota bacterium]